MNNISTKNIGYLFLMLLVFSSCGTSKKATGKKQKHTNEIVQYAHKYLKSPYRYGGTTPKGFDCSGYVQFVYKNFGYHLPRSTSEQIKFGKEVKRKEMKPGDLVFFKGRNKKSKSAGHVGIVTEVNNKGDFRFIHASTSKGITVDDCKQAYYKDRYLRARRVIH